MSQFPETAWSMIDLACNEGKVGSREHMGCLLATYWQPMYAHLRYKGVGHQQAEDLVQEFSLQILESDLLSIADPSRGKFRTLLLTALDRFAVSKFRFETAAKRAPASSVSLDAAEMDITTAAEPPVSAAFDRAYALDVLAEVLAKMKEECEAAGEGTRWEVFESRVISPTLDNSDVPDYTTIATQLGFKDDKVAMNLLVTAKRQFTRILRKHVRDYVTRNPNVDHYIAAVKKDIGENAVDPTATMKAATQITERAVSILIEEEIDSLKKILADSRGAGNVEIDKSHVSAVYKSGFLARLHNTQSVVSGTVYEWGKETGDELTDEVLFQSILDTQLQDVVAGHTGSIRDMLIGRNSDSSAVKAIKDWVNLQRVSREPLFPRELATGIYYSAIAAALVHHDRKLSSLQNNVLQRGFASAENADWMDPEVRDILKLAMEKVANA